MKRLHTFGILKKLYLEGGLTISTPFELSNGESSENEPRLMIETVIQADADVMTYIPETAIVDPKIREACLERTWQAHLKKTEGVIRSIRRSRMLFKGMSIGTGILGILFMIQGFHGHWIGEGSPYALPSGALMTIFSLLAKRVGGLLFQQYIKWKMMSS